MSNNVSETLIGAAVVATAAGFLFYAGQVGGASQGGSNQYSASFFSAEGLAVGSEVHLAGVQVGTVTELSLNAQTYQAVARFDVIETLEIPDDTEAKIASEGLLGGTFLELTPGGSDVMLADGGELIYTQGALSLINLLMKFVTGPDE